MPAPVAVMPCRRRVPTRLLAVLAIAAAMLVAPALTPGAAAAAGCQSSPVMNVVSHPDDDLLFMVPAISTDISAGRCLVTVYVTAGDAGAGSAYWQGRERGARAASARMAGVADSWTRTTISVAGHPVVQDTLNGAPNVRLVFLRLPDGGDGAGYPSTGQQSLQRLWQSTISSIRAVDGSATYSRSGLITTFAGLMATFRPVEVRTHDYLGTFGSTDHSDHFATAYFVREGHYRYPYRHRLTGYRGYRIDSLPANLTAEQADAKLATFLAYAPYDRNVCQTRASCLSSSMASYFSRQYLVGSELGGVQNAAPVGTVSASSQNAASGQTAAKAVDGVVGGYPGATTREWATLGGRTGSWIEVTWPGPHTLETVALYDRPNADDQVTAGALLFGDGSSIAVGALPNDATAKVVSFTPRRVTRLRLRIDAVSSTTHNVGLAELQAFTTNVAPLAAVAASSQNAAGGQTALKAVDGYPLGYPVAATREWATVGGRAGSWLRLTWAEPVTLRRIVLYDRPNLDDQVTGATLRFSDGSVVSVSALPNDGSQRIVDISARTVTSLELSVTAVSPTTYNIGLTELQAQTS